MGTRQDVFNPLWISVWYANIQEIDKKEEKYNFTDRETEKGRGLNL